MISREIIWNPPAPPSPERALLSDDDVHVWRASLNQPATAVSALARILTPDELDRAAKYHFQKDRDRFIVARAVLRLVLSRYVGIEPDRLRFRTNSYGKPALDVEANTESVCFNLSHSNELALYAVARNREIGIDIEYARQNFDAVQIARGFFSPGEIATLNALPESEQLESFFRCWTRKEAYIKARGMGLSLPLAQFDVSLSPNETAALLNVEGNPAEVSRWSMRELTPADGYLAAIVIEGHNYQLNCFEWPAL